MNKKKQKKRTLQRKTNKELKKVVRKEVRKQSDDFIMKPKVDFCFKELMLNPNVRKGFIAAVLGMSPEEIKETRLLPTIMDKHYPDDKMYVLDVRVELNSRQQIDMEMQVGAVAFWRERSTLYLSKMYVEQMAEGNKYDMLEKCIHIGIVNFELFPDEEEFYSRFHLREDIRNTLYTDKLKIHVIELPKVKKNNYPENDILHWTNFFNVENKKELDSMMNKNEYIDEACEQILKISSDEEKRMKYEARVKASMDHNSAMSYSFNNGLQQGLYEAYDEGEVTKKYIIKKLEITEDEFDIRYEKYKKQMFKI